MSGTGGDDAGLDLGSMRREYGDRTAPFSESDLAADWVTQFEQWFADVMAAGLPEPSRGPRPAPPVHRVRCSLDYAGHFPAGFVRSQIRFDRASNSVRFGVLYGTWPCVFNKMRACCCKLNFTWFPSDLVEPFPAAAIS